MCPSRDSSTEMHSEDVEISQVNDLRCINTGAVRQGTELLERLIYKMCQHTTRPTKGHNSDHVAHHLCRNGLHASPKRSFLIALHLCFHKQSIHVCLLHWTMIHYCLFSSSTPDAGHTMQHSNGFRQLLPPPAKGTSNSTDI